ncbi:wax ester/triacylglycerol synthase family O-acyltransferase [Spongiibacter sp. KMU-158]|uniref:diacylglycerol O-acyltransferase n=1 Tax=Spongiibacter pelagi TaxID=2760804 RepID=A0A927C135_9GAMM|nr:wax ester/triacylglycerol synthase family O-acyltransferase [Spongiibacter pelagi]MBD2858248.1 wax ester/triacylglycerol synthase family O-acyltransferase [Spongiibacter pelagi]
MKRLSLIDDSFLRLESRRTPLHIGMLMLFEPPADAGPNFASDLYDRLSQCLETTEPFNWLLVKKKGLHYWQEDDDFDLENHFVHTVLPKPGRIRELLALVSRVHCAHLDRMYPLWRIHLIEGLEDGRFALYIKVHHSLVDGGAAMRTILSAMSPDQEVSKTMPALWDLPVEHSSGKASMIPQASIGSMSALRSLLKEGAKSARSPMALAKELYATYQDYRENSEDVMLGLSPNCALTQSISSTRRFAAQSYSKARIKVVAKAFDATTNDVVLAMCGSAVRKYLMSLNDLPERPVMAGVPVSTRMEGDTSYGNEVAFAPIHLGTHIEDPAERMWAIKRCMDNNKKHMRALEPSQIAAYSTLKIMPGILNSVLKFAPDCGFGGVVISHVPGPQQDMYWQGAKLSGMYPMSLLLDGAALNITLISRHDAVDFGLIACRKALPSVQRMLDYLEDALVELEDAAEKINAKTAVKSKVRSHRKVSKASSAAAG